MRVATACRAKGSPHSEGGGPPVGRGGGPNGWLALLCIGRKLVPHDSQQEYGSNRTAHGSRSESKAIPRRRDPRRARPARRNTLGQEVGRAERQGAKTTFYDRMGRQIGRADHQNGTTTYYDNMGRQIGTPRERR